MRYGYDGYGLYDHDGVHGIDYNYNHATANYYGIESVMGLIIGFNKFRVQRFIQA